MRGAFYAGKPAKVNLSYVLYKRYDAATLTDAFAPPCCHGPNRPTDRRLGPPE
jgi:hypothetical protein